jgi:hypothetical protein
MQMALVDEIEIRPAWPRRQGRVVAVHNFGPRPKGFEPLQKVDVKRRQGLAPIGQHMRGHMQTDAGLGHR